CTSQVVGGPGRGGSGLLRAYGVGPTGGGRSGRIRTCGRLHMRELLCRAELRSVRPAGPAATSVAEDGRCCRASCHGPTQSVVEGRRRSPGSFRCTHRSSAAETHPHSCVEGEGNRVCIP